MKENGQLYERFKERISMHIWIWAGKKIPDWVDQSGNKANLLVANAYLNVYLQKGDDKRSQREVGCFLELGVEFFDGQGGILEERRIQRENT